MEVTRKGEQVILVPVGIYTTGTRKEIAFTPEEALEVADKLIAQASKILEAVAK